MFMHRVRGRLRAYWQGSTFKGTDARRALIARMKARWIGEEVEHRRKMARDLTPVAFPIARELGYRRFTAGSFEGTDALLDFVDGRLKTADWAAVRAASPKAQLLNVLQDVGSLQLDSPLLQFGLRHDVLASVAAYLGVVPVLAKADIWYSQHKKGRLSDSQLFHCDWDDQSQVKLFVLCSEVEESNGPLVLLDAGASKAVRDAIGYRFGGMRGGHISDDRVIPHTHGSELLHLVGSPGTVVFADTSRCFHYGSRVAEEGGSRVLVVFQYVTPTAFLLPLSFELGAPLRHLAGPELPELPRRVLGWRG